MEPIERATFSLKEKSSKSFRGRNLESIIIKLNIRLLPSLVIM